MKLHAVIVAIVILGALPIAAHSQTDDPGDGVLDAPCLPSAILA